MKLPENLIVKGNELWSKNIFLIGHVLQNIFRYTRKLCPCFGHGRMGRAENQNVRRFSVIEALRYYTY